MNDDIMRLFAGMNDIPEYEATKMDDECQCDECAAFERMQWVNENCGAME